MAKKRIVSKRSFVDPNKVDTTRPAGTNREYQGTVESQWTCNSCGTTGIPGGNKRCPNCSHPKDASETYEHPPTNAPYLSAQQIEDMGVDVTTHESDEECPFCSSRVKPGTQVCPNCNSVIADAARTTHYCPNCGRESKSSTCPTCSAATLLKKTPLETNSSHQFTSPRVEPEVKNSTNWPIIGSVLIGLVLIGVLIFALWPREGAVVTQANWKSTIYLEEYQYNQYGGWNIPPGGEMVSIEQKFHHNDKVFDHTEEQCHWEQQQVDTDTEEYTTQDCDYEDVYSHTEETCYDDGTCDRYDVYDTVSVCTDVTHTQQVPVYDDVQVCQDVDIYRDVPVLAPWYIYNIWEWNSISPAQVSGTGTEPFWPTDYRLDEIHRESGREQVYSVIFFVDTDHYTYNPSTLEEYRQYYNGSEWMIKRSGPNVIEVNPLD